ncbi:MAG: hypothetical protein V3U43_04885 [Pseudomonadales bacterium]
MTPPRALAVPFDLGRPLGAPNRADFQHEVLRALLALATHEGPGPIFEEFSHDAPHTEMEEGWACPVNLAPPPDDRTALELSVADEIARLRPWHDRAVALRGHTATASSTLEVEEISPFLNAFLSDSPPTDSPVAELSLGDAFKLAAEDLKAFYAEAATARPDSMASADEYGDWFWDETAAGALLKTLREGCAEHPDPLVKGFAAGTLVPATRVRR